MSETITAPAAPVAPAPPAPAAPPAAPVAWYASAEPEIAGFIQNKGVGSKDAAAAAIELAKQYANLEKMRGVPADRLLTLPLDPTQPGAMDPIYEKLGRPARAEEYGLKTAEDKSDADYVKWASDTFHKIGLTKAQAEAIDVALRGMVTEYEAKTEEAAKLAKQADIQKLQQEWGATYDANINLAKQAAAKVGAAPAEIAALTEALGSDSAVLRLFQRIGKGFAEPSFVTGQSGSATGVMTPEQAAAKVKELKGDPEFVKLYNAEAVSGMEGPRTLQMRNLLKIQSAGKF
jgi:hypothetical protein